MANRNQNAYYFYIDGLNIAKYIESWAWEYNDIDAPKSGRTLDAVMHRGRLTDKRKINVSLVPVTATELAPIIAGLRTQYVTIRTNMLPEGPVSYAAYNSARSGGISVIGTDGIIRHKDVKFNIIER